MPHLASAEPRAGGVPAACPECGAEWPVWRQDGLCERCLARGLMEGWPDGTGSGGWEEWRGSREGGWAGGVPLRLGDYDLEMEVAHGGMGIVYRARQRSLGRAVAVKLLLLGRFAGAGQVDRFLREAAAAARLRHPNIVGIHEVGEQDGQYYYSMDYIEGTTLAERMREGPVPVDEAVRLGRVLAGAVQYAHGQGVLHRDLKPSNVLIDGAGEPHIADFGLAKLLTDGGEVTRTGELLGSPCYLSPEQAAGRQRDVGVGADVYGLGAVLYELLTGRPPFLGVNVAETLRQIADRDPVPPRWLHSSIPADLEAIVLKCLEKAPARRYATARDLGSDLERFADGLPTLARPAGMAGRGRRWVRRHPMAAAVLALLISGLLGTGWLNWRAQMAQRETQEVNARLSAELRRHAWQAAEDRLEAGKVADGLARFARLLRDQPGDVVLGARLASLLDHHALAWPLGDPFRHGGPVACVAFGAEGETVLTAAADGRARLWRVSDGQPLLELEGGGPLVHASIGGGGGDRVLTVSALGAATLWRTSDGAAVRRAMLPPGLPELAMFDPRGTRVAWAAGGDTVIVVTAEHGETVGDPIEVDGPLRVLAVGAEALRVVTATEDGGIGIWSRRGRGWEVRRREMGRAVTALGLSPSGDRLLVGLADGTVALFDANDPAEPRMVRPFREEVVTLLWSPDGNRALILRFGEWPELWDLAKEQVVGAFGGLDDEVVLDVGWHPDSRHVVLAYRGGMARVYDTDGLSPVLDPFEHEGSIVCATFDPGGGRVATASHDGTARVWDVRGRVRRPPAQRLPGRVGPVAHFVEGRAKVTVTHGAEVRVYDAMGGDPLGPVLEHDAPVRVALLAPDAQRLATGGEGVSIWESVRGRRLVGPLGADDEIEALAWSADGRWLWSGTREGVVRRWNVAEGGTLAEEIRIPARIHDFEPGPGTSGLAVLGGDASVRVLEMDGGAGNWVELRHRGRVRTAAFSRDGRRLLTSSVDRTAQIWDLKTGQPAGPPLRHEGSVLVAQFSPDETVVATGGEDRTVRLWDAATGRSLRPPLRHPERVWVVDFSRDGRRLLTVADRSQARVWDVATGLPLTAPLHHGERMLRGWFLPDDSGVVTVSHGGTVTRWSLRAVVDPAPAWLPAVAEALAGRRIRSDGSFESAPMEILRRGWPEGAEAGFDGLATVEPTDP